MNPAKIKIREGDCEIIGQITLEQLFGKSIVANLALISTSIFDEFLKYPRTV